ncbi:MAG: 50S ribosomal protein L4 [Candidatus Altiarchaeota archaeon]
MADVYSIDGKKAGKIDLPGVFSTEYRPDLIQRGAVALQSSRRQPYGVSPDAGLQTTAEYYGRRKGAYRMTINKGMSRLPREKTGGGGLGKVRRVPQSVGGRRSHPPRGKDYTKKINSKEYTKALESAIASTKNNLIIVEDKLEGMSKTKEIIGFLSSLKVEPKNLLLVVGRDGGILKAASNVEGVQCVLVDELDVEQLTPAAGIPRRTIWTKSAIEVLSKNGS